MKAKSGSRGSRIVTPKGSKGVFTPGELKQFIRASLNGDIGYVRSMLKRGVDPNLLVESLGSRPLAAAACGGHVDVVKLLLSAGADPNLKDTGLSMPPGGTPLENACERGHVEIARLLVDCGADINLKGYWPPLRSAISHGQLESVRYLLSLGAAWEASWLYHAIATGKVDLVRELIEAGANVNYQSDEGYTPLHWGASHESPAIVTLLLERGAKPNVQCLRRKETPLTKAAQNVHLEVVRALLSGGANPLLTGPKCQTPEQCARLLGRKEVAKFLRDYVKAALPKSGKPSKVAKTPGRVGESRKRSSRRIAIPRSRWAEASGPFGASDFVEFVCGWGHPEWVILAVEAPLAEVLAQYSSCFPGVECKPSVPIEPSRANDKGLAEWMPFVQPIGSKWTVLFRVVCLPIGSQDVAQALKDAELLSMNLRARALSFLGEDTSGAMQCDLFDSGKSLGTECWENQGADANGLFKKLGLYIPACYPQKSEDSLWLAVWPSSQGKVGWAALIREE